MTADLTPVICAIEEDLRELWRMRSAWGAAQICDSWPEWASKTCPACRHNAKSDADSIRSRVLALRILRGAMTGDVEGMINGLEVTR
jgi:hypothetical protein